jgi:hypothetical protein
MPTLPNPGRGLQALEVIATVIGVKVVVVVAAAVGLEADGALVSAFSRIPATVKGRNRCWTDLVPNHSLAKPEARVMAQNYSTTAAEVLAVAVAVVFHLHLHLVHPQSAAAQVLDRHLRYLRIAKGPLVPEVLGVISTIVNCVVLSCVSK